jgi:hypothetical protein
MKRHPQIASVSPKLNPTSASFAEAVRDLVPQIQAALAKGQKPRSLDTSTLLRAPLGAANGGPPKEAKEPDAGTQPSHPARMEEMMLTQPSLSEASQNGKSPLKASDKSVFWPPFPEALIEAIGDAAVARLEQTKFDVEALDPSPVAPSRSIETPGSVEAIQGVECKTALYLRLVEEPETPGVGYSYLSAHPQFCSAFVLALNLANRVTKACLASGDRATIGFFCGRLIEERLARSAQTPLIAALRAALYLQLGWPPNLRVNGKRLAAALATSPLLERIGTLPIFGKVVRVGASFRLSTLMVLVSREALGKPWNRPEARP